MNSKTNNKIDMKTLIKRLSVISCSILLAVFFYSSQNLTDVKIVPVVSVPVTNKVIVLDAGHGLPDEGAQSSNGTTEASINLSITLKIQKLLESSGANVILTRSDENAIYEIDSKTLSQKKVSDIRNRVKIGNKSSADIFVSIHLNKFPEKKYYGWQTFYKSGDEGSKILATKIQENLNSAINKENTRVPHSLNNVYIMKHVELPTSIVECGFLSNPEEEKELLDNSYQDKLAWGIYNGIMDYFNR